MKKNCLNCGVEYEAQRKSSKYCSDNCRILYFRKRESGEIVVPVPEPQKKLSLKGIEQDKEGKELRLPKHQLNPLYELHSEYYTNVLEEIESLKEHRSKAIEHNYQMLNKDFGLDKAILTGIFGGIAGYMITDNQKGAGMGLLLLGAGGYLWGIVEGKEKLPKILDAIKKEIADIDYRLSQLEAEKQNHIMALRTTDKFIPINESSRFAQIFKESKLPEPQIQLFKIEPLPEENTTVELLQKEPQTEKKASILPAIELIKKTFDVIPFQEPYRSLIGEPPFGFHAIIYGLPGQGKSTFAIQFANYLASNHGRVLYISAEEGHEKTLVDKIKQQQSLSNMLDIADVSDAEKATNIIKNTHYPFVFVDSADRLGLSAKAIQDIKAVSKSSLIVIHQSTKSGEMRGVQELKHDADIVIAVDQYQTSTVGEKNRYGVHNTVKINPLG